MKLSSELLGLESLETVWLGIEENKEFHDLISSAFKKDSNFYKFSQRTSRTTV